MNIVSNVEHLLQCYLTESKQKSKYFKPKKQLGIEIKIHILKILSTDLFKGMGT